MYEMQKCRFAIVISCLPCLQPADITIVKSMKSPPGGVKIVMAAVCVMKEIKPEKVNDPAGTGQKVRCDRLRVKRTLSIL